MQQEGVTAPEATGWKAFVARRKKELIIALVFIVLGGILGILLARNTEIGSRFGFAGRSGYQAVFLVNNQVYFGKLSEAESQYPVLREIYYLQINQAIQPVQGTSTPPLAAEQSISLVKLGAELHGPVDEMRINRDHILLIEDLRGDSNVVQAIQQYTQSNPSR